MGKKGAVAKRRRRIIRVAGGIFLLMLVMVAALPLWFPWILRTAGKQFGATYTQYERDGYERFQIHQLLFTNASGRFEAEHIQAFVPTVWVWKHFLGRQ